MKTTKSLLLTLVGVTLTLIFSACDKTVAVNNSPANAVNTANTAASGKNNNSAAANNTVVQTNSNSDKRTVTKADDQEKQAIFQLIKRDEDVSGFLKDSPKEADTLIKSLTVRKMDLNADGQPEYVAVLENGVLCGAHANCPQWVYDKKGDAYNLLRRTHAQAIKLEKTSTRGYLDLRAEGSDTATTNSYVVYTFDGTKYQPAKCVSRDESAKPPKETTVDCKDMGEEIQ